MNPYARRVQAISRTLNRCHGRNISLSRHLVWLRSAYNAQILPPIQWKSTEAVAPMPQTAAVLYVAMVTAVIVFQLCLTAGAPWGKLTQGGRHEGALPASARIAAGLSIVLLACMAAAITSAAGMVPNWPTWIAWARWPYRP